MSDDERGSVPDPDYTPHKWPLSEKSDVWSLGLIAHSMMYAHRKDTVGTGTSDDVSVRAHTLSKITNWKGALSQPEINVHESHFEAVAADISHLPDGFSAQLCLFTMQCLRHNINARPSLDQMLQTCRDALTRLEDTPDFISRKRKRERDEDEDEEPSVLTGSQTFNEKFGKYKVGERYQPKRARTRVDLADNPARDTYTELVNAWSGMKPSTADGENAVIDAMQSRCKEREDKTEWALQHLVSCLSKRSNPERGAVILTPDCITYKIESDSIETIFQPETKIQILEELLDDSDLWENAETLGKTGGRDTLDALNHAIRWGLMMLQETTTPATEDAPSRPAEPREPKMRGQSALHKGIYDWIFIKPTGAFYKN